MVDESLLPWLYVVGANLIRNRRRRLQRGRQAIARLPQELASADIAEELLIRLDDEREMHRINEIVGALRPVEQDVFVLCAWQGLSYEQAAAALDVPVGTVRSRLARARAHLRELLGAETPNPAGAAVGHDVGGFR